MSTAQAFPVTATAEATGASWPQGLQQGTQEKNVKFATTGASVTIGARSTSGAKSCMRSLRRTVFATARFALTNSAGGCTKELGNEPRSWIFNLDDYIVMCVR